MSSKDNRDLFFRRPLSHGMDEAADRKWVQGVLEFINRNNTIRLCTGHSHEVKEARNPAIWCKCHWNALSPPRINQTQTRDRPSEVKLDLISHTREGGGNLFNDKIVRRL